MSAAEMKAHRRMQKVIRKNQLYQTCFFGKTRMTMAQLRNVRPPRGEEERKARETSKNIVIGGPLDKTNE